MKMNDPSEWAAKAKERELLPYDAMGDYSQPERTPVTPNLRDRAEEAVDQLGTIIKYGTRVIAVGLLRKAFEAVDREAFERGKREHSPSRGFIMRKLEGQAFQKCELVPVVEIEQVRKELQFYSNILETDVRVDNIFVKRGSDDKWMAIQNPARRALAIIDSWLEGK